MWNTGNHTQEIPHFLTRVFTLGNASNTFTETTVMEAGTTGTRLHSSIFALNLDKFAAHSFVYTDGSVNLSASAYATELATATLTAPATGTMIIGSSFQFDVGSYARTFKFRCQAYEDGGSQVDQPAGQTTASYLFHEGSQDSSSDIPEGLLTDLAVTDGLTYRVDVDASTSSTTSSPAAKHRSLWLFSTELSASAPEGVALGRGLIRILP
jgi:hypothetical protein